MSSVTAMSREYFIPTASFLSSLMGPSDVGDDRGGFFVERAPERSRELDVVGVVHREDPTLRDLARQVLENLRERLFRHAPRRRVVDVDLAVAHLQWIQRSRILQRHVDPEVEVLEGR